MFDAFRAVQQDGSLNANFNAYYASGVNWPKFAYGNLYASDQREVYYKNGKEPNRLSALVFKDSYANPITPYLAQHFYETTFIDTRFPHKSLQDMMKEKRYDIIIMFDHDMNLHGGTYRFKQIDS